MLSAQTWGSFAREKKYSTAHKYCTYKFPLQLIHLRDTSRNSCYIPNIFWSRMIRLQKAAVDDCRSPACAPLSPVRQFFTCALQLQRKANDVWPGCHHNILFSMQHVGHWRCFHSNIGWESPHRFAVVLIHGSKSTIRLTIKNQSAGGC